MSVQNSSVLRIFSNSIDPFAKNHSTFSTTQLQNKLNLYFFLSKKTTLYLNSEYYYFASKRSLPDNYYFGDLGIKFNYKKIDLELACNNITNNRYFVMQSLSDNFKAITQTQIRPRTLILKCYFKF